MPEAVDNYASTAKLTRSAIVRESLRHWLKENEIRKFENQWIRSLKQGPDDAEDAETWIEAQQWSD